MRGYSVFRRGEDADVDCPRLKVFFVRLVSNVTGDDAKPTLFYHKRMGVGEPFCDTKGCRFGESPCRRVGIHENHGGIRQKVSDQTEARRVRADRIGNGSNVISGPGRRKLPPLREMK